MKRLQALIGQLHYDGTTDHTALIREKALADLRLQFSVPLDKIKQMQLHFLQEMVRGLTGDESTIKMLPSFVKKADAKTINGDYYALDLGGTNFRVIKVSVKEGEVQSTSQQQHKIPKEHMEGTAEGLFGFIADCVKSGAEGSGDLGFTFSFPCQQITINSAKLIKWTKGFSTSGVEGQDVGKLLQTAFNARGIKLKTAAICNDTVGTLVTQYFQDSTAAIGVILGTGFNAAYWEKLKQIRKLPGSTQAGDDEYMCINMECGNFDSREQPACLPLTKYDTIVDRRSPNPGAQFTEKIISGMYLGPVCREVFLDLATQGAMKRVVELETKPFDTWQMSFCLGDTTSDLVAIEKHFLEQYNHQTSTQQRNLIREVCWLVATRSARVAVAAISTIALKMGVVKNCTVSVDGSVFEKVPGYKQVMEVAFRELSESDPFHYCRFKLTKEGSGVGAALIAALASKTS